MTCHFKILLNEKWCKDCGICAAYCPKTILVINEMKKLIVAGEEKCIGCGLCEFRCPDMAITVEKREVK